MIILGLFQPLRGDRGADRRNRHRSRLEVFLPAVAGLDIVQATESRANRGTCRPSFWRL